MDLLTNIVNVMNTTVPIKQWYFNVIIEEQTPVVPELDRSIDEYLVWHKQDLKEFLRYASSRSEACGLAANQCELNGERFQVRAFALMNLKTREWRLIVNPIIIEKIGIVEKKLEGCLTWPRKKIVAERYCKIIVDYHDIEGNKYRETVFGFEAQIWQHEINHLNGIEETIVDFSYHLSSKKRERNDLCECGSGLKYKKCCLIYING